MPIKFFVIFMNSRMKCLKIIIFILCASCTINAEEHAPQPGPISGPTPQPEPIAEPEPQPEPAPEPEPKPGVEEEKPMPKSKEIMKEQEVARPKINFESVMGEDYGDNVAEQV